MGRRGSTITVPHTPRNSTQWHKFHPKLLEFWFFEVTGIEWIDPLIHNTQNLKFSKLSNLSTTSTKFHLSFHNHINAHLRFKIKYIEKTQGKIFMSLDKIDSCHSKGFILGLCNLQLNQLVYRNMIQHSTLTFKIRYWIICKLIIAQLLWKSISNNAKPHKHNDIISNPPTLSTIDFQLAMCQPFIEIQVQSMW